MCTQCPSGFSTSLTASTSETDCLCSPGKYFNDETDACDGKLISYSITFFEKKKKKDCQAGFYKSTVGNEDCTSCPLNTISEPGSSLLSDCTCQLGHAGDSCDGYFSLLLSLLFYFFKK